MNFNWTNDYHHNPKFQKIFLTTRILRKPICGIVSGYHVLPYVLVAPNEENPAHSVEIQGKINVSPKFVISAADLSETFGDVFDPETFDNEIQGRLFSFAYNSNKQVKVKNENFTIQNFELNVQDRLDQVQDNLLMQENVNTGLIFGPHFKYYPISLDRFINEIIEREF